MPKFIGILFMVIGAGVGFWLGPSMVLKTRAVEDWDSVVATIESVEVELDSSGSDGRSNYVIDFVYRYTVNGREYTGDRYQVARAWNFSTWEEATEEANRFRDQERTVVYVNPDAPEDSVLLQGGQMYAWMACLLGWIFLAAGYFVVRKVASRNAQAGF